MGQTSKENINNPPKQNKWSYITLMNLLLNDLTSNAFLSLLVLKAIYTSTFLVDNNPNTLYR